MLQQAAAAEGTAFLGEQRAGLQPVQQAQQHLVIARRQGVPQCFLAARQVAEGRGAQLALAVGHQGGLQGGELGGGDVGHVGLSGGW